MNKFFCLETLLIGKFLLCLAHSEASSQFQPLELAQNSQSPTWIAIYNKSSYSVAASSNQLDHNTGIIVRPNATQVHFAQATEAAVTQFIKLNPNDPNAYFYQGLLHTEVRKYKGAEADYTQVIRLKPNDADAYNRRGLLRKDLKNYRGVEMDFTQVIKLNPNDAQAYFHRGLSA